MNDTTPVREFKYIRDAAELRLRLEPWRTDQKFGGQKDGIFYAVDTDVVKLFSDPEKKGKYVAVFSSDDVGIRKILAWALGRFIFFRLTKDRSLLIIPPHHQEMDRVFAGIARNAAKERTEVSNIWPRLEKHLQEYKRTNDMDALVSSLKKEPLDLIRFVYGEGKGYTAELARITELLRHDRLLHIERYLDRRGREPLTLPVLHDETVSRDYDTLKELSELWSERLGATKSKKRRQFLISDDAEMLARLEWINRELEEIGKRLVLISGDTSLQRAAAEYYWDNSHTFADLFIRDPRVFLAAPDFLTAKPMNEGEISKELKPGLIEWLDVFLARFQPGSSGYDKRLREDVLKLTGPQGDELAHKFLEKISDGISKLKRDWKQFIRLAGVEYGLGSDREHLKKLVKIITKHGLSQVRKQVDRQVSKVWHDFWKVATETGYWSTDPLEEQPDGVMDKQQVLPLRGVPALRFTLKWADALSKDLCCTLDHEKIFQDSDSLARLKKEDQSNYTASVIYALAFGAKGRWGVARTLLEFALYIADYEARDYDLPEGYEPVTGNEAAYVLAWAIRHNVKSAAQLHTARPYLEEATRRKAKATGGDGTDIRYKSESIAIDMTYHLFRLFSQEKIPADVPTLAQCQKRILELLRSLELDKQEKEYISLTVKKQLLVYLFCALLLRQFKDKETGMEQEQEILQWLPKFKAILECKGHRTKTCFTQPAYLCACYLYGMTEQQKECLIAAKKFLSRKRVQRCYVMPYDEALYAFFMDIITGHHT